MPAEQQAPINFNPALASISFPPSTTLSARISGPPNPNPFASFTFNEIGRQPQPSLFSRLRDAPLDPPSRESTPVFEDMDVSFGTYVDEQVNAETTTRPRNSLLARLQDPDLSEDLHGSPGAVSTPAPAKKIFSGLNGLNYTPKGTMSFPPPKSTQPALHGDYIPLSAGGSDVVLPSPVAVTNHGAKTNGFITSGLARPVQEREIEDKDQQMEEPDTSVPTTRSTSEMLELMYPDCKPRPSSRSPSAMIVSLEDYTPRSTPMPDDSFSTLPGSHRSRSESVTVASRDQDFDMLDISSLPASDKQTLDNWRSNSPITRMFTEAQKEQAEWDEVRKYKTEDSEEYRRELMEWSQYWASKQEEAEVEAQWLNKPRNTGMHPDTVPGQSQIDAPMQPIAKESVVNSQSAAGDIPTASVQQRQDTTPVSNVPGSKSPQVPSPPRGSVPITERTSSLGPEKKLLLVQKLEEERRKAVASQAAKSGSPLSPSTPAKPVVASQTPLRRPPASGPIQTPIRVPLLPPQTVVIPPTPETFHRASNDAWQSTLPSRWPVTVNGTASATSSPATPISSLPSTSNDAAGQKRKRENSVASNTPKGQVQSPVVASAPAPTASPKKQRKKKKKAHGVPEAPVKVEEVSPVIPPECDETPGGAQLSPNISFAPPSAISFRPPSAASLASANRSNRSPSPAPPGASVASIADAQLVAPVPQKPATTGMLSAASRPAIQINIPSKPRSRAVTPIEELAGSGRPSTSQSQASTSAAPAVVLAKNGDRHARTVSGANSAAGSPQLRAGELQPQQSPKSAQQATLQADVGGRRPNQHPLPSKPVEQPKQAQQQQVASKQPQQAAPKPAPQQQQVKPVQQQVAPRTVQQVAQTPVQQQVPHQQVQQQHVASRPAQQQQVPPTLIQQQVVPKPNQQPSAPRALQQVIAPKPTPQQAATNPVRQLQVVPKSTPQVAPKSPVQQQATSSTAQQKQPAPQAPAQQQHAQPNAPQTRQQVQVAQQQRPVVKPVAAQLIGQQTPTAQASKPVAQPPTPTLRGLQLPPATANLQPPPPRQPPSRSASGESFQARQVPPNLRDQRRQPSPRYGSSDDEPRHRSPPPFRRSRSPLPGPSYNRARSPRRNNYSRYISPDRRIRSPSPGPQLGRHRVGRSPSRSRSPSSRTSYSSISPVMRTHRLPVVPSKHGADDSDGGYAGPSRPSKQSRVDTRSNVNTQGGGNFERDAPRTPHLNSLEERLRNQTEYIPRAGPSRARGGRGRGQKKSLERRLQ